MRNKIVNDQPEHCKPRKVGPPMGNRNSAKGGSFTKEIKEERKQFSLLVKNLLIGSSRGSS